jgi:hypothetical protein
VVGSRVGKTVDTVVVVGVAVVVSVAEIVEVGTIVERGPVPVTDAIGLGVRKSYANVPTRCNGLVPGVKVG